MPWGRLDDKANGNAKLLALSDAAWRMWGCGLIYCQDNLTDGFIPEHVIHTFGVRAKNKPAVADELCSSLVPGKGPLWHRASGGYQVHDYLDWNDSREDVLAEREAARLRQERFRGKPRRNGSSHGKRNALQTPLQNASPTPEVTGLHVPLPQDVPSPSDSVTATRHPIREFLAVHETLFEARFGRKPAKYNGKDAAIAKRVIDRHGEEQAVELLRTFMASQDEFAVKTGFGINVLESQINRLITVGAPKGKASREPWHWQHCPHDPKCGSSRECSDLKRAAEVPA